MTPIDDAYRKYSTERFSLPSEEKLNALEQRIRVTLPEDYRRFLVEFNGGYFSEPEIAPSSGGWPQSLLTCLHGIGATHRDAELALPRRLALFDDNDPPRILPIGHTPMGSLIILVTEPEGRGEIFLKQAYGDFYYLADGIEEFFALLHEPTWKQAD